MPSYERLADERVRKQIGAGLIVGLDQQPGRERFLQRAEELLLGLEHDPFEQGRVDVATDHGGHAQELDRRRLEPAQAPGDDLLDALWQPEALELRGSGTADTDPRLEQVPDDLLDEERVAFGLLVQRVGEGARRALAGTQGHERGGVRLAQAPECPAGRRAGRAAAPSERW